MNAVRFQKTYSVTHASLLPEQGLVDVRAKKVLRLARRT